MTKGSAVPSALRLATSRSDVATSLDLSLLQLNYQLVVIPENQRYKEFSIQKRDGSERVIATPITRLKQIQRRLLMELNLIYSPRAPVNAFTKSRNVVTNARGHRKKEWVLCLDLEDFFGSINFGRVMGMFMAIPYEFPKEVAVTLAQICCYKGCLPQGAPTSPIISNMICAKMDSYLRRFAEENKAWYTRYADDMAFSSRLKNVPESVGTEESGNTFVLGESLRAIIEGNGFQVNEKKTRFARRWQRQKVTGLVVNKKTNVPRTFVRQIRAMLHDWKKNEIEEAQRKYRDDWDCRQRNPEKSEFRFRDVVKGKLAYLRLVKGATDPVYLNYARRLQSLDASLVPKDTTKILRADKPLLFVRCEGKTDWRHLKAAFKRFRTAGSFFELNIQFEEFNEPRGGNELLKLCRNAAQTPPEDIHVCIFDRDDRRIINQVSDPSNEFKTWDQKVYSIILPILVSKNESDPICIEHYYNETDLQKADTDGRRIFLAKEFDKSTGKHIENGNWTADKKKLWIDCAILDAVFDQNNQNIAMSKARFAELVQNGEGDFGNLDISEFSLIFERLKLITKKLMRK